MIVEILLLLVGAVLGVGFTVAYNTIERGIRRRKPLDLEFVRSKTPPLWFATNEEPPEDLEKGFDYEREIVESAAFCGFAKLNLHITNRTDEVVYITDIAISKKPITAEYRFRVRTIPQGCSSAIRLVACLDDDRCFMSSSLSKRYSKNGDFFESGERIKIAPGETEYVFLSFVTVNHAWTFNCNLKYSIHGATQSAENVFGGDLTIVPYLPEAFEVDYCSFLERVDPDYERFDDAPYFSADMRESDPAKSLIPISSAMAFLESEIE